MTRRSLALRRSDGSAGLRPDVPGYVDSRGSNSETMSTTRTALSTCTTLEFAVRVKVDALGVTERLAGWGIGVAGATLTISAANLLTISLTGASGAIGNVVSSATIPAATATQPVWLRGKLTVATAVCEYWYSLDITEVYEQIIWTAVGTPQTGTNAGTSPTMANSASVCVTNNGSFNPSVSGNVYAFYELVNGVKTTWFVNTDIPDPPATSFVSAGGGQVWTQSATMIPAQFVPSQSFQGGLRADFSYDTVATGLGLGVILGVVDVNHTTVRVSYQPALIPSNATLGPFREAMVVRSTAGFPATNLDGSMVMRHLNTDPMLSHGFASVLDTDLAPQRWYYYCLFARYDDTSGWFKIAEQAWLNPAEFGYPDRLYEGFPDYYRRVDSGGWSNLGVLRRLCNVIGYEFDAHRTWAATVGDVWDFEKLSAKLIPEAGGALGLPQEVANSDRQLRTLVGNIMALRKKKGTKDGVEGYVSALTGYPTRAYEGLNLLLRLQHAEWPNTFSGIVGDSSPSVDNNPGWTTFANTTPGAPTVSGVLARQTMASNEGNTIGLPDGTFYLRNTNNTGASSQMFLQYGSILWANQAVIPVTAGHTYQFTVGVKTSAAVSVTVHFFWINERVVLLGTSTAVLGATTAAWAKLRSANYTAPAGTKAVMVMLSVPAGMVANSTLNIVRPMFVDKAWRPEGIPSLINTTPLSSAVAGDAGTYIHQDFYEPPREVKVNVYPNRTNLALNSNFVLDNLPPGAWSTFDAPTYGQLPIAYDDYADIIDAAPDWETSYADMASGLYPLTGTPPTIVYDTGGGRLHINKTSAPYGWTLMHTYFPATDLGGMSAAVGAYSSVPGVKMTLGFEWYDAIGSSIKVNNVPVRHMSPEYTLSTVEQRCEVVNAQPPDTALYGRLLVMVSHTAAHDTSLNWALIEDSPYPESYFDGTFNDGEDGDFFFAVGKGYTGGNYLSPSVYYMRFRRFASGVAGADALTTLMPQLLPFRRSFKVVTAATGLYNVPV